MSRPFEHDRSKSPADCTSGWRRFLANSWTIPVRETKIKAMIGRFISVFLASTWLASAALAVPVAIVNPGFEAPYLGGNLPPAYNGDVPPTAFPVGAAPSGWQAYGAVGGNAFIGVLNPGVMAVEPLATYFPAGAAEGDNVALTFYRRAPGRS